MRILHGKGFDDPVDRKKFTPAIFLNIITSMKTLLRQAQRIGEIFPVHLQSPSERILACQDDIAITSSLAADVGLLWSDAMIQSVYAKKSMFQLNDNAS